MSDAELFTRLNYCATIQMGMSENRFWFMPIGAFLDLWACHRQWLGVEKAVREVSIDEVVPV